MKLDNTVALVTGAARGIGLGSRSGLCRQAAVWRSQNSMRKPLQMRPRHLARRSRHWTQDGCH